MKRENFVCLKQDLKHCQLHYGFSGREYGVTQQSGLQERLFDHLSWDAEWRTLRQTHGNTVQKLSSLQTNKLSEADGILLDQKRILCFIRCADCLPVFLYDIKNDLVSLLHAGREGIAQCVLKKAVELMCEQGVERTDITLRLGPAIGGCCYPVTKDMAHDFFARSGCQEESAVKETHEATVFIDLKNCLAQQAENLGLIDVNVSSPCTRCQQTRFYSHRAGDTKLRQYAFAWLE